MIPRADVKLGEFLWLKTGSRRLMVLDVDGLYITAGAPDGFEITLPSRCFTRRNPAAARPILKTKSRDPHA